MRRMTAVLAVATLSLLLGLAPAATAQTVTTLPGIPAGQGGPDNNVNPTQQGGDAQGGRDNPAADAGPAVSTDDDASLAPWLIGAAVLVLLAAGAVVARRAIAGNRREPTYSA
ncbi:MAG TPA: hypothetical protein VM390_10900 [Acidimicrobiales bacterium]|jgi:MYXO-CTERM domain-containing protein|nr:hypothetical protein [Acidimicrobiales bacterium]